jgi:HlyD family secretion protein
VAGSEAHGASSRMPFKSGMTASVDIRTVTRNQVLAVPIAAITTRNPDKSKKVDESEDGMTDFTKTWVFIYKDGKANAVEVKTGIQDINSFEVLSGLKKDDEVISAPGMAVAKRINDGDKVLKVDKDKVFEVENK